MNSFRPSKRDDYPGLPNGLDDYSSLLLSEPETLTVMLETNDLFLK